MKDEFDCKRALFFKNTQYLFKHPDLPKVKIADEEYQEKYKQYTIGGFMNPYLQFPIEVEKALDEYLMFKYNISSEQIKKIIESTNNFKLKHNNFMKIITGNLQYWYDEGTLILTADQANLKVYKYWRFNGRNI